MTIPHRTACWARVLLAAVAFTAASGAAAAEAGGAGKPAASSPATPGERERIAAERGAVETRFASRERECRERFVVTSCIDDAKRERRQALDRLRARQLDVDEARRHERAAERKAELADKAAEDARVERERAERSAARAASGAASQSVRARTLEPHHEAAPAASAASGAAHRPGSPAKTLGIGPPRARESAALRQEREARSRAAFEARRLQAAEHREEAADRAVRRMASKSPAAALPVPSAASAPKSR